MVVIDYVIFELLYQTEATKVSKHDELSIEIQEALDGGNGPKIARFALACLGAIPVAGGVFGGAAGAWSEADQAHYNKIFASWLKTSRR